MTTQLKHGIFHEELKELIQYCDGAIAEAETNLVNLRARRDAFVEGLQAVNAITDPATIPGAVVESA